jgi:hypothetical protein
LANKGEFADTTVPPVEQATRDMKKIYEAEGKKNRSDQHAGRTLQEMLRIAVQHGLTADQTWSALDGATEDWAGLVNFGATIRNDEGFRSELRDSKIFDGASSNQIGHFLTGVGVYRGDLDHVWLAAAPKWSDGDGQSYCEMSELARRDRAVVAHELVGDKHGNELVQRVPYGTHVDGTRAGLGMVKQVDVDAYLAGRPEQILNSQEYQKRAWAEYQSDVQPSLPWIRTRRASFKDNTPYREDGHVRLEGSSVADLRLSLKAREAVVATQSGELATAKDVERWMMRNVLEPTGR